MADTKQQTSYVTVASNLKGSVVYLAGPIQYTENGGTEWRLVVTEFCKNKDIKVYSPTNKPKPYNSEIAEEMEHVQNLINASDFEYAHEYIKDKIVHVDLRMVDKSDFIIAYINPNIHTCGSYHEIFHAWEQKKPVLVFIEGGKKKIPSWLLGVIKPKYLFDTLDSLLAYLRAMHSNIIDMDSKWVLFDD